MINPTGNLVLNGITDAELVKILEVKMRHEHSLNFNPQQLQPVNVNVVQPGQPIAVPRPGQPVQQQRTVQVYNNVVLQWSSEGGLEAVQTIFRFLLEKEEAAKAAGQ